MSLPSSTELTGCAGADTTADAVFSSFLTDDNGNMGGDDEAAGDGERCCCDDMFVRCQCQNRQNRRPACVHNHCCSQPN
jgi:hypothetical protein